MAKQQEKKYALSLAGEFAVCAELLKRNVPCNLTFGNAKAADIILLGQGKERRAWIVEVKTTDSTKFVTNFFQKYPTPQSGPHPDFWVLVRFDRELASHFYIMTHSEMAKAQMRRNKMKKWASVVGLDNVLLAQIEQHENKWDTIVSIVYKQK
nr:hypothetical protein [Schwartzia sp. (in: firmicutes)]